jgi:hypothetical protein
VHWPENTYARLCTLLSPVYTVMSGTWQQGSSPSLDLFPSPNNDTTIAMLQECRTT